MTEPRTNEAKGGPKPDCDNCHGTGWWSDILQDIEMICPCTVGPALKNPEAEQRTQEAPNAKGEKSMRCTHCGNDICDPCWKARVDRRERGDLSEELLARIEGMIRSAKSVDEIWTTPAEALSLIREVRRRRAEVGDEYARANAVPRPDKATNALEDVAEAAWELMAQDEVGGGLDNPDGRRALADLSDALYRLPKVEDRTHGPVSNAIEASRTPVGSDAASAAVPARHPATTERDDLGRLVRRGAPLVSEQALDYPWIEDAVTLDIKQRWYAAGHHAGLQWAIKALERVSDLATIRDARAALEYLRGSTYALPNELPDDPRSDSARSKP